MASTLTVFSSAARGSGANASGVFGCDGKGAIFVLDVTAVSGTSPTLDLKIQVFSPLGNDYVDLAGAAFAQKTAANTSMLTVYPGIAETANVSVSDVMPPLFRAVGTVGGSATPTVTFSLACYVID